MTFKEFQAARVWSDDLRASLPDVFMDEDPSPPQSGWIYEGYLYIEEVRENWPNHARKHGRWYLILGNWQKITDDLTELERELYDYAVGEEVVKPPPITKLQMEEYERLAETARATSEEDWGSERQIAAENAFCLAVGMGDDEYVLSRNFARWSLKATSDEMLDEALRLLRLRVEG